MKEKPDKSLYDWMSVPGKTLRIPRRRRRSAGLTIRPECKGCPIASLANCGTCQDEETDFIEGRGQLWYCRFLKWIKRVFKQKNPFHGVSVLEKWKLTPSGNKGDPRQWWRKLKR